MARIRADYVFGTTDTALAATDTTFSSPGLASLPTVATPDTAAIILHDDVAKAYEIVTVTAHTSGATTATVSRGQEGSTAQAWASGSSWQHGPTVADFSSGSSGGSILAFAQATASAAYATSSSTDADVDATNLVITFTFPTSGHVMIELSGTADAGTAIYDWTLRQGTTTVVANTMGSGYSRRTAMFYVTGTAGQSATYKWGHRRLGSTGTVTLYTGGNAGVSGNAMMRVTSMP